MERTQSFALSRIQNVAADDFVHAVGLLCDGEPATFLYKIDGVEGSAGDRGMRASHFHERGNAIVRPFGTSHPRRRNFKWFIMDSPMLL